MTTNSSISSTLIADRRALFSLLVFCFALVLILFRLTSFAGWLDVRATWTMVDFRTAIYYPVVAFLVGHNPYGGAYLTEYPVKGALPLFLPFTLVLHAPFGLFSFQVSSALYLVCTLGLTVVLAYVSLAWTKQAVNISTVVLIAGLVLLTRPGHWNTLVGQLTLQFVLASYAALYFARRAPILSGIALAVSAIKPTFGIPIALLMLFQGHVRPVLYGAVAAAVTNLPLLLLLARREGGTDSFLSVLVHNRATFQEHVSNNPALSIIRIDASAFISRMIQAPIGLIPELAIFSLILGVAAWTLRRNCPSEDERDPGLRFGVVCLATLLCSYHQAYDLLLLTLPFVSLVGGRFPDTFYSSSRYPLSVALLAVLALNYSATHSVMRFVQQGSALWLFLVSINSVALLALFWVWIKALGEHRDGSSSL